MTQIKIQGKSDWINQFVKCGGSRDIATRMANWCLNHYNDINVTVPDNFEMYYCRLVTKSGDKITNHQPCYLWRLNGKIDSYMTLRKISTATEDYTGSLVPPDGDYGDDVDVDEDDNDEEDDGDDTENEEDEPDWDDPEFGDEGGELEDEGGYSGLYSLAGAVYEVRDSDGKLVDKFVTDEDGYADEIQVAPGTYKVEETIPAKGFKLDPTTYSVTVTDKNTEDNPAEVGTTWTLDTGEKVKAVGDEPIGYMPELSIYKIPNVSNPDNIDWDNIPSLAGAEFIIRYYRVENREDIATSPIVAAWKFTAKPENRCYINGKWITTNGKFGLIELGKDAPTDVYQRDINDPYFHSKKNNESSLPLGWYTIRETKAPPMYKSDENKITYMLLDDQGGYTCASFYDETGKNIGMDVGYGFNLDIPNEPESVKITMHKVAGETIPDYAKKYYSLENATYQLLNEDGTQAKDINGVDCIFTTDANGKARQTFDVRQGVYKIKETTPSKGFKIDTEIQNELINLADPKYTDKAYDAVSTEHPDKPKIKIHKAISEEKIAKNNPLYDVRGTTFALYSNQDDAKNSRNAVKTFTINANGESPLEEIFFGDYYLTETKAGAGLLIPNELKPATGGVSVICNTTKTVNIP